MKFVKKYALEICMVVPLFLYIMGCTFLPVFTNVKNSFIDQKYGRKCDILVNNIRNLKVEVAEEEDEDYRSDLKEELIESERDYQQLLSQGSGYSLSNYRALFYDKTFRTSILNTRIPDPALPCSSTTRTFRARPLRLSGGRTCTPQAS